MSLQNSTEDRTSLKDVKDTHEQQMKSSKSKKRVWQEVDGGFGWVQVFAAGIVFFFLAGVGRSFSLIYEQLIEKYGRSDSVTSWVPSVSGTVKMCSSPLVGLLIVRFNERTVCFIGAIASSLAVALTALAPSIEFVFLAYGFLYGIGVNCCIISSHSNIAKYFDKKLGRAMGIASFSMPLGGLVLSPLTQCLFDQYDYRGAMLIISAILLHTCVSAVLIRPRRIGKVDDINSGAVAVTEPASKITKDNESCNLSDEKTIFGNDDCNLSDQKTLFGNDNCNLHDQKTIFGNKNHNVTDEKTILGKDEKTIFGNESCNLSDQNTIFDSKLSIKQPVTIKQGLETGSEANQIPAGELHSSPTDDEFLASDVENSLERDRAELYPLTNSCTLNERCETKSSTGDYAKDTKHVETNHNEPQRKPEEGDETVVEASQDLETSAVSEEKNSKCCKMFYSVIRGLELRLLKNYQFTILCGFLTCFVMCVDVTITFQTALVREKGYSQMQAVTSLMISNFVDLPWRLLSGFIYDQPMFRTHQLLLSIVIFFAYGLCMLLFPFALDVNFILGMICLSISVCARAMVASQYTHVMAVLVGSDKFASAISLSRFIQGIGLLISSPTGGFLKDTTGTYASGFLATSSLILLLTVAVCSAKAIILLRK